MEATPDTGNQSQNSSLSSWRTGSPLSPGQLQKRRQGLLRLLALLVGCVAVGISYLVNAFNVFAIALKKQFGLTQIQLELLLSLMFLGLCASLPGGLLLDRYEAKWAAALAMLVSTTGYVLIWLATLYPDFYNQYFSLLALYFFIAGIGGGLTYITATASNVRNFGSRLRATVMGVLHASMSSGPALLMLIYNSFFMKGHITDEENQDVGGFMIFVAIVFFLVNLLGLLCYDYYPPSEGTDNESTPLITDTARVTLTETFQHTDVLAVSMEVDPQMVQRLMAVTPANDTPTGIHVLLCRDYQLLFWPSVILAALQMMFVQNLTTILASFGQQEYNTVFPYVTPILGTLLKPLVGLVSDLSINYVARSHFLILGAGFDLLMWIITIFFIYNLGVVLTETLFLDIAICLIFSLVPTLIIEKFGIKDFPRNWGLVFCGFAILTGVLVTIFGVVYDAHVPPGALDCLGRQCFAWTFVLSSVLSLLALVCFAVYIYYEHKQNKADRKARKLLHRHKSNHNHTPRPTPILHLGNTLAVPSQQ